MPLESAPGNYKVIKKIPFNFSYTREVRESEMLVRGHETALRSFKEELAGLLSDGCCVIDMTEESIRDRLKTLIHSLHDRSSVCMVYNYQTSFPPAR